MMDNDIKKALDELVKLSSGIVINWEINQSDAEEIYKIAKNALDLINRKDAEIEKLNVELVGMRGACESYKMHYDKAQAEIERLTEENKKMSAYVGKGWGYVSFLEFAKNQRAEAIKEFAERLKEKVNLDLCEAINCSDYLYDLPKLIEKLVKEMTEGSDTE